ncbi:MAG: polyphenol oxidase family protein [Candidatus Nitrospinota bacterium M3_3B_026]
MPGEQSGALALVSPSGAEVYRFPALEKLGFRAFVSGRRGGVSPAPFDSLNTASSGGDSVENVEENIRRIMEAVEMETLWTPRQVHGDGVAVIDSAAALPSGDTEADAVVVTVPGAAVGVKTADCLPVLFSDRAGRAAAAIHAGRRSVEAHLPRKTARMMIERFSIGPEDIIAALGPRIGKCCYEVDEETARRFHGCCGGSGGRKLDLAEAVVRQLEQAGVRGENILDCGICVSCENERFFSYRGDGLVTGRFMTGIELPG